MGELSQVRDFRRGSTQMHADIAGVDRIPRVVIGYAFRGMNGLGAGVAEKVYANALAHEMGKAGLAVLYQQAIAVRYDGIVVGERVTDLLVGDSIILQSKAVRALDKAHMAQCNDYLTATGLHVCLLLKFGRARVEAQRIARDLYGGTRHLRTSAANIPCCLGCNRWEVGWAACRVSTPRHSYRNFQEIRSAADRDRQIRSR